MLLPRFREGYRVLAGTNAGLDRRAARRAVRQLPVFVPPRFMGGYTLENTFTLMGRFSVPQANLLAALTQWIVEQNPDISDGFITNGERKPACDALTTRISLAHRGVMR